MLNTYIYIRCPRTCILYIRCSCPRTYKTFIVRVENAPHPRRCNFDTIIVYGIPTKGASSTARAAPRDVRRAQFGRLAYQAIIYSLRRSRADGRSASVQVRVLLRVSPPLQILCRTATKSRALYLLARLGTLCGLCLFDATSRLPAVVGLQKAHCKAIS